MHSQVTLKSGKDKAIRNRHHWIFSGAIESLPDFQDGEILPVFSSNQELLGYGYFNRHSSIIGRMVAFGAGDPIDYISHSIKQAIQLRLNFFCDKGTNAYRLINGEGDFLPGLIVDRYADLLVIQISTLGMDRLRSFIVDCLRTELNPRIIYEKSLLPSRKEEGLKDQQGLLHGDQLYPVEIIENHLKFIVDIKEGQKTGFFLDQREMRALIAQTAKNKKVLNCFSYTGGFSIYAASGKAKSIVSLDISEKAIELTRQNMEINGFSGFPHEAYVGDVFKFLRENDLDFDLLILDPPAFAKKKKDIVQACRGYKDINRLAIQKMSSGSLLLTCSCSYHVDEILFQKVVFQASIEAQRKVRILGRQRQAFDHPINLAHPEGNYLKSLFLFIE